MDIHYDIEHTELAEMQRLTRRVEALVRGAWIAIATALVSALVLASLLLAFGRDGQRVIHHRPTDPPATVEPGAE